MYMNHILYIKHSNAATIAMFDIQDMIHVHVVVRDTLLWTDSLIVLIASGNGT